MKIQGWVGKEQKRQMSVLIRAIEEGEEREEVVHSFKKKMEGGRKSGEGEGVT